MTEKTDQQLAPDETAEDYLAALLVKDEDCRERIVDSIRLEMFQTRIAHAIFAAVSDLMVENLSVDQMSLAESLKKYVDDPAVTLELINGLSVSPENVDHYIERVQTRWHALRTFALCVEMQDKLCGCDSDMVKLIAEFEDKLLLDDMCSQQQQHTFTEAANLVRQAKLDGGLGYSWGIPLLDIKTRGIIPGRYTVIGGLKKSGKTLFAVNTVAELVGNQNVPCLIFSLEMSFDGIAWALLSRQANVDSALLGTDRINNVQISEIEQQAEKIDTNWPIYIDSRKGITVEQITAAIRRHVRKGVKVVVIDYLQRIDIPNLSDNRATAIQKAVNKLADAAAKYDVALLVLSQLANRAEFQRRPTVADFKESGGITEACDCALLLHNVDRAESHFKEEDKTRRLEIIVAFQRVGESGLQVDVTHDLKTAHFYEITKSDNFNQDQCC